MFDPSAPHIIILLVVVLLLFGAGRMPGAAKALGQSMHIFKKSIHGEDENGQPLSPGAPTTAATPAPPAVLPAAPAPAPSYGAVSHEQQLADLQRQVADLQRQNAGPQDSAPAPEAQHSQQPF